MSSGIVRAPKDFWAGAIYVALGLATVLIGLRYSFGSGARMGPGYFPTVLGYMLAVLGSASILRSFIRHGEPIDAWAVKPMLLVVGSTGLFGAILPGAGLVLALLALTLMSAAASQHFGFDLRAALGLVVLIGLCALVFVVGLGVPMPLFGHWLTAL